MKELIATSKGIKISELGECTIRFEHTDAEIYGDTRKDEARIRVLSRLNNNGYFGVIGNTYWSVHLKVSEAEALHYLLPDVEFKDERVSAAESLADIGGAA